MWQKCPRQKHLGFDIRDQSEFVEQMALSVFVLFFLIVLFPEQGFMCFVSGARIKCRSCRLDRCLQQGMRKEAVTSGIVGNEEKVAPQTAYLASISLPSTSTAIPKVTETASCLRQTLRLITKFRKCNIIVEKIDLHISALLTMPSFLDNLNNYQEETDFKRDLPEWCTIDLLCAIEFAKKLPDLSKFSDSDKEELIRNSCFTIAIAIEAIESYFDKKKTVVMPDGTDVMQSLANSGSVIHAVFTQMFVCILDPLHRESFTIDELVLTLQLLFFTIAAPENLTPEGKEQLEKSVKSSMHCLMVLLITQNTTNFSARYGSLIALNETFIKTAHAHKQKMKEAEHSRQKFRDFLIEQCVFDYRPAK
ncbi:NR LBD domain-containing protein [Caenorhabditis elegans]|uniref:NR LBD domain-containing protein n=1 Tax=Caenorhabditis elegans TaxID=6239 RepID=G5EEX1_CAEEL|nr:NR LBD domain-containing protein [Caenorhabditis elegans]CCD65638.1 NR LBD domain-containing protein [Caenorhabditis elegans]|eukprot:NP_001024505.1 Nuclear Hormone Receptor family [Caenorhabditis elegans]